MGYKNRQSIKRILAVLLCAFIFITGMPEQIFAEDDQTVEEENILLTNPGTEESTADNTLDDPNDLLESYMDNQIREELGSIPSGNGMRKAASSKRREKLNDGGKFVYDTLKELIDKVASGQAEVTETSVDISGLLSRYFVSKTIGGTRYKVITSASLGISSGVFVQKTEGGYTYWTLSNEAKEKLYDFDAVIYALMADEPYAMYWYDKTSGVYYGISGLLLSTTGTTSDMYFEEGEVPKLEVAFAVSDDYRLAGGDITSVDIAKTGATSLAVTNAAKIITDNKSKSDLDILNAYKDGICGLTSYNDAAAENENIPYGDPWQMIYVFDGNSGTNVVCEGYSKAFQYLCDHTDFNSPYIECDSVTGLMGHGNDAGLHMWNILHMDDEENYIADLTNSDTGMVGSRGGLFISPAMSGGSVAAGYSYDINNDSRADLEYTYDEETLITFTESELTMPDHTYTGAHIIENAVYEWAEDGSSCTASGVCADCGDTIIRKAVITKDVKVPATCMEEGTASYTATFRQHELVTQSKDIDNIPALGHDYAGSVTKPASEGVTGVITYTCRRCNEHYTRSIPAIVYPTDLPTVKISKPKAGKRKMTVRWKKVSKKNQKKISGIQIQVATDPGFTNIIARTTAGKKKTSKAIKGLQSKTKYYVRIRAYAAGNHVSVWKSKSVKVK